MEGANLYETFGKLKVATASIITSMPAAAADTTEDGTVKMKTKKVEEILKSADRTISIDVGGEVFKTTIDTLTRIPGTLFASMFSGDDAFPEFLDIDPEVFRYILNYFRNLKAPLIEDAYLLENVKITADKYCIPSLLNELQQGYSESILTSADAHMRRSEDAAREHFVKNSIDATSRDGGYWMLKNMFSGPELMCNDDSPYPLVFGAYKNTRHIVGSPAVVDSFDNFRENLRFVTGGMLDYMDWNNVILAGGSVLAALLPVPEYYRSPPVNSEKYAHRMTMWFRAVMDPEDHNGYHQPRRKRQQAHSGFGASDLDLFIYGLSPSEATEKLKSIRASISRALSDKKTNPYCSQDRYDLKFMVNAIDVLTVRTKHAVTMVSSAVHPHAQVILRVYTCPAEVLMGFDIDSCCVGFDGQNVYGLPRAIRALTRRENVIDPNRQSRSYECRLAKYAKRGFAVSIPSFRRNNVDFSLYSKPLSELQGLAVLLRLEMLDNLKRPLRARTMGDDRTDVSKETDVFSSRRNDERVPENAKDRDSVLEYQFEKDAHHCDYSSVFLPQLSSNIVRDLLEQRCFNAYDSPLVFYPSPRGCFGKQESDAYIFDLGLVKPYESKNRGCYFHAEFTIPEKIQWITENPGRQYVTGSFEPLSYDWFACAYGN